MSDNARGQGVLTVSDNGPGIDPADRPRIFERFFRSPTATGVQGSGVGLAIVDQLVRAHGGEVGLSAAERGTTIEVRIPTRAGAPIVRG